MYLCILASPFLSFFSTFFLGRFIGNSGACTLSTLSIFISFFLSLFAFFECAMCESICTISLSPWISCELLNCSWGFLFDSISVVMLLVVCGVSSLVHLYASEYMSHDPHQGRFMGYLSLFTGFMLLLVTADNFLVMFFGWEGIGLASFLLIGFWFNRIQAGKSAIKAMIVNRVGDIALILGISTIFLHFKTVDYIMVFSLIPSLTSTMGLFCGIDIDRIVLIAALLFLGCIGKSAQIGLHVWLPDAMEGPTPVSALIHAATLVTAGVFLIIRCSSIFENAPSVLFLVTLVGAFTSFFASSVGLVQNDFKRVIAYSTCSQLGYMIFAAGLSNYSVALFHLANHAIFKALLFLSAGCVIHGLLDEQDLRKMGGLLKIFPLTYTSILIGSLALMGFPFLTGFYSKDVILELAFGAYSTTGNFAYFLGCCAAFCTAFYSFRLLFLAFFNEPNSFKVYVQGAHEAPFRMSFPLIILGLGSIFWGFISREIILGVGSTVFGNTVFFIPSNVSVIDAEFLTFSIKNIPLIFTCCGTLLSFVLIHCFFTTKSIVYRLKMASVFRRFHMFLSTRWHFDQLLTELVTNRIMNFGYLLSFQLLDKGLIEFLGPLGISSASFSYSRGLSLFQSAFVVHYLTAIFLGLLLYLTFLVFINFVSVHLVFLIFSYVVLALY